MPNQISSTNFRASSYVSTLSRYINSTVVYYGKNNLITFKTYTKNKYPESPNDKFTVIPGGMEYRPDLVSQQAYGTVDFWWKIMEANSIMDIFDFKSGLTIRLPNSIF
jgi:hypothetical protein